MFCKKDLKELDEALIEAAKKKRTASASAQAVRLKRNIHNSIVNVKLACDFGLLWMVDAFFAFITPWVMA